MSKNENFEKMGGRKALITINKIFYDKVYLDPWLKLYFEQIPQQHIEDQQVDFMQKILGGENLFVGKAPPVAHMHVFVSEELFALRQELLKDAFIEAKAHPKLVEKWLMLDQSFKRIIVKKSPNDCQGRFKTDPVLNFPKPRGYVKL
ncbi:MAG: group 1 truncated hemoglobin [Colwellia sp.]|nr:group 1 truncated hemoglobin [Colwellia sp.]